MVLWLLKIKILSAGRMQGIDSCCNPTTVASSPVLGDANLATAGTARQLPYGFVFGGSLVAATRVP